MTRSEQHQRLTIIDSWRIALGDDLLSRDPAITAGKLTILTAQIIERCLALRLCADRAIITIEALSQLATHPETATEWSRSCAELFGAWEGNLLPSDAVLRAILMVLAKRGADDPFAALSLEDLGTVRESFLDRPLRIVTGQHVATTGEKGGRKASGSFYTPPPLADYLMERALGLLLAERTPDEVRELTILDPACGGGIFLLAAFRYLVRWYRAAYRAAPQHHDDRLQTLPDGTSDLTLAERRRILRDHLYGIDRDPQAVETTRLTLLIACREQSDADTDVDNAYIEENLRQGDTLLDPAWLDDAALDTLSADERGGLMPLDWPAAYPAIMARGGFDLVIGNPPFLSYSGRQAVAIPTPVRQLLTTHYRRAGWPAAHAYFIERAATTLARRRIAFVVPDQVGHLAGYASTRALLPGLIEARYWGEEIFAGVTTPILTFVADREHHGPATIIERDNTAETAIIEAGAVWQGTANATLMTKLCRDSESLGALVGDVGVHSGNCARKLIVPREDSTPDAVPILEGRAIGRYSCAMPEQVLRLGYRPQPGEYRTIRPEWRYREATFLIRQTATRPIVGPRRHATYFRNSLLALYPPRDGRAIEWLVGLLNSRLFGYLYAAIARESRQQTFPQVKIAALRRLPIKRLDLATARDRELHDTIVVAVRQILAHHERLATLTDEAARQMCASAIAALDRQIDHTIYDLYGLDVAEIELVERAE